MSDFMARVFREIYLFAEDGKTLTDVEVLAVRDADRSLIAPVKREAQGTLERAILGRLSSEGVHYLSPIRRALLDQRPKLWVVSSWQNVARE